MTSQEAFKYFEELVRAGTIVIRTTGSYSDYHIEGLYRARRDVRVKLKRPTASPWNQYFCETLDVDAFEPLHCVEIRDDDATVEEHDATHFPQVEVV